MRLLPFALVLAAGAASPAVAQDGRPMGGAFGDLSDDAAVPVAPLPDTPPGQTATSTAGRAGQRRTREQIAQDAGIEPMGRINGRIQNRVQSRIRNRIDRYYDPQANATSPFAVAGDQLRTAGRRVR